jgi:hypothetical protein
MRTCMQMFLDKVKNVEGIRWVMNTHYGDAFVVGCTLYTRPWYLLSKSSCDQYMVCIHTWSDGGPATRQA